MISLTTLPDVVCSEQLKQGTKAEHANAEKLLIPKLKHIKQVADYAAILALFYGFYSPLEQQIHQLINNKILPDIERRSTSEALLADLASCGFHQLPKECTALPVVSSVNEALGALYVVEGSTLGGQYIIKMLQAYPSLKQSSVSFHFFNRYGDQTMAVWNTFKEALNQQAMTDSDIQEVSAAAKQTFSTFACWIKNFEHGGSAS